MKKLKDAPDVKLEKEIEADEVKDLIDKIDEMLLDDTYSYAEDTLSGIKRTVEKTQKVTLGQKTAVSNIEDGGDKSTRGDWGDHGAERERDCSHYDRTDYKHWDW